MLDLTRSPLSAHESTVPTNAILARATHTNIDCPYDHAGGC